MLFYEIGRVKKDRANVRCVDLYSANLADAKKAFAQVEVSNKNEVKYLGREESTDPHKTSFLVGGNWISAERFFNRLLGGLL